MHDRDHSVYRHCHFASGDNHGTHASAARKLSRHCLEAFEAQRVADLLQRLDVRACRDHCAILQRKTHQHVEVKVKS